MSASKPSPSPSASAAAAHLSWTRDLREHVLDPVIRPRLW
jgi:hypothetical protein